MGLWPHCSSTPFSACSLQYSTLGKGLLPPSAGAHTWDSGSCQRPLVQGVSSRSFGKGSCCGGTRLKPGDLRLIASPIPRAAWWPLLFCASHRSKCPSAVDRWNRLKTQELFWRWQQRQLQLLSQTWNLPLDIRRDFREMLVLTAFCRHPGSVSPPTPAPWVLQRKGYVLSLSLAFGRGFFIWVWRKYVCYFWYKQSR